MKHSSAGLASRDVAGVYTWCREDAVNLMGRKNGFL